LYRVSAIIKWIESMLWAGVDVVDAVVALISLCIGILVWIQWVN
jgi:hypothetical protein